MSKLICPYAKQCDIYQGKQPCGQPSLLVYKNVFCHRGLKGWSNCNYYVELKKKEK
ncbi:MULTISPECIES: hypothetical protein [unclassified Carboxylicivirga]|uniref:hypothetical protein n=1 Tax=Carboxylicivirga TaxID=1628153 RepID=UPI003D350AA8